MALQITNQDNNFYLSGNLDKNTSSALDSHFAHILKGEEHITINLSQLDIIDMEGVKSLHKIKNNALAASKSFQIIGRGSQPVSSHCFLTVA